MFTPNTQTPNPLPGEFPLVLTTPPGNPSFLEEGFIDWAIAEFERVYGKIGGLCG